MQFTTEKGTGRSNNQCHHNWIALSRSEQYNCTIFCLGTVLRLSLSTFNNNNIPLKQFPAEIIQTCIFVDFKSINPGSMTCNYPWWAKKYFPLRTKYLSTLLTNITIFHKLLNKNRNHDIPYIHEYQKIWSGIKNVQFVIKSKIFYRRFSIDL